MQEGQIVKAVGGFYDVKNDEGIFRCRARGLFRKQNIKPLVGDYVAFADNYVQTVEPRTNELHRPPIANIDQVFLVSSITKPAFSAYLLDRILVHVEALNVAAVIVVTKQDIATAEDMDTFNAYRKIYEDLGYPVTVVSRDDDEDRRTLLPYMYERVSVLAGQSGVGKSALLNRLAPELQLETGEISEGLARGKHTTRQVELLSVGGGRVADTPGFSSLDFTGIEPALVQDCFPEISEARTECKYRGCTHRKEDGCGVKAAVERADIARSRYEHYRQFFNEVEESRRY
ncbi:ribosome small subunit-dependent GTPase A [Natribacillus halophilus]|uniref:Small ribosomal subunit biogenesis GTPase RsgA n=1 Tax=Natribacillus halophilus TaxID=549003 RepID=A0A1G8MHZ4_9BACI|nr:ribosome small subunit-dependent GTPase A [Natribacillus halophilus]SDI67546.1 ribosome biogenesis GTPase [Natribacillus halophilus]